MITIDDFKKLDLRVGKVVSVEAHPNADKLLVLKIDAGGNVIQAVAGIKKHYSAEELTGRKVVVIVNLQPVSLRGVESQGMILAATNQDALSVVTVDKDIPEGSKIS